MSLPFIGYINVGMAMGLTSDPLGAGWVASLPSASLSASDAVARWRAATGW